MDARDDLPEPPPEAALIRRARQARGMTAAEAADEARIVKASRWGQIENGYLMKSGRPVPTAAGDMQLAHMANVVGISPDELARAGRTEAASILERIQGQKDLPDSATARDELDVERTESPVEAQMWREIRRRVEADPRLGRLVLEILRYGRRLPEPLESGEDEDQQRDAG